MLKLFLWLKYVRRRRIILLSVVAVALSVSLLIVVASLFTGFIAAFEHSAVDVIGDVIMLAPEGMQFQKYPALIDQLEQTSVVEAATGSLSSPGLLHLGGGNVRPVNIWGIEPQRQARVMGFKKALLRQGQAAGDPSFAVADAPDKVGGVVGIGVLAKPDEQTDQYDQEAILKERIGQQVLALTGTLERTPEGERIARRKTIPFRIVDVAFTGVYQLDSSSVYLPIQALQQELYPKEKVPLATSINIKLKPGVDTESAVAQIRGVWRIFGTDQLRWSPLMVGFVRVQTARELQRQYIAELEKQKHVLELIFSVISFSVVVLVFCIFYMMVRLKQKDIAILKSCGASSLSVIGLFLGFGISVGVAGSGLGAALGYLITRNINQIEEWIRIVSGLKLWKSSVYMFDRIPNQVDWSSALMFATLAMIAAAAGALMPALLAARTRPVEVLRYE